MADEMELKRSASETSPRRPFAATIVFSVILFLIVTGLALRQSPRPYPLSESTGWQAFAYPREQHAMLRLPLFSGAIHDLFVLPGSELVWAVGQGGLVLRSDDAGLTWRRQTLPFSSGNGTPAAAAAVPSLFARAHAADVPVSKKAIPNPPGNLGISGTKDVPPDTYEEKQQQQDQQQIEPTPLEMQSQETEAVQQEEAATTADEPFPDLNSVWFLNENIGVVAGTGGAVYRTENGGETWQPVVTPSADNLDHLFRATDGRLLVAAADGVMFSSDQGATWERTFITSRRVVAPIVGFAEFDPGRSQQARLLALDERGGVYRIAAERSLEPDWTYLDRLAPVAAAGAGSGYLVAVGAKGYVVRSPAAKLDFETLAVPTQAALDAVEVVAGDRLLVAGEEGTLLESYDNGNSWKQFGTPGKHTLRSVAAVSDAVLLVAGEDGVIERSDDGGQSWHYTLAGEQVLAAYYKAQNPGARLRVSDGVVEVAAAGSDDWQTPEYSRSPAIWYWLVCGYFALVALGIANHKRLLQEGSTETVADVLASDRPLRPGDPDPLEFGAIARGLSRFMRNPKTEPPLTVAITGAWGTGKSSLMNLLHHDLQSYGFTPVWFNAWHHQKGEQLLASLYANIRSQAVPGWFAWSRGEPVGLLFRINLLFRRSAKNRIFTVLLVLVFTAALVYLGRGDGADYGGWIGEKIVQMSRAGDLESLLVVLFGNLAPVAAALRALRAFGLNPQNLMAVDGGESGGRKRVDPGARQRFAREFNDVSSSLELGRMVIFIDDLDRCRQDNVVDILEAVNFLAVSGNCYIVIGMDEKWVRVCIEQQFQQMISDGQSGHAFSENYLEKLINIKVPVPTLEADSSTRLLTPELPPKQADSPLRQLGNWLRVQWLRYRYLMLMMAYAALGILLGQMVAHWSSWFGDELLPAPRVAATVAVQQWDDVSLEPRELAGGQQGFVIQLHSQREPQTPSGIPGLQLLLQARADQLAEGIPLATLGSGDTALDLILREMPGQRADASQSASGAGGTTDIAEPAAGGARKFVAGEEGAFQRREIALASALLLLLLASIGFYLLKQRVRIVSDSPLFRDALNLWHPWIMINRQTPRAIKRYLNRVRYIAMRYRQDEEPARPWWRRLLRSRGDAAEAVKMDENFIDEAQLVALSAIFSVDESWLGDEDKFELLCQGKLDVLLDKKFEPRKIGLDVDTTHWQGLAQRLQGVLDEHLSKFGDGFLDKSARLKFLKVVTATEFA